MRFPSMLRRLRNTQGGGARSTARSRSTPYYEPPVAEAGSNQTVLVNETVRFDGLGSTGNNLIYSWDFGAGATPATGSGITPSCTYSTPGTKVVTLTVTDNNGSTASDTVTINVHSAPVAEAGSNQTVLVGETVNFDGSGSYDPDGGNLSYSWDFGTDATPATGSGEMPSCTYSTTGAKTVTLTVTDPPGATASDTVTITVEPVADAGNNQVVLVGETVNFDGSGSTGNNLSYSWAFGADADPPTAEGVRPFCLYSTPGDRTVTLSVTDDDDIVSLDEVIVTAVAIDPQTVNDGESVDFEVFGSASATGFTWGWEIPSELGLNPDVGNSPAVVFSPADSREITINNARWYAYPDRACPTGRLAAADKRSVYTITCDITFPDGRSFTATSSLTVNVPWVLAGFVQIGFSGSPTIAQNSGTRLWEVTGRGTMQRILRSQTPVPASSQFYAKVQAHEQVHFNQVNTGLASSYYTINDLWANHLRDLTADNRADLEILIQWAVDDFIFAENDRIRSLLPQLERAAYQVSDAISPQYLYQRCDRFPE